MEQSTHSFHGPLPLSKVENLRSKVCRLFFWTETVHYMQVKKYSFLTVHYFLKLKIQFLKIGKSHTFYKSKTFFPYIFLIKINALMFSVQNGMLKICGIAQANWHYYSKPHPRISFSAFRHCNAVILSRSEKASKRVACFRRLGIFLSQLNNAVWNALKFRSVSQH